MFLLGFIWILIDERNRGWHDKILDTYVVDLKESAAMHEADARRSAAARPAPKSAPVPAAAPANEPAPEQAAAVPAVQADVTEQPSVTELPDSVLDVADVVVETAKHAAAEAADKTEYDTVNARTGDVDE